MDAIVAKSKSVIDSLPSISLPSSISMSSVTSMIPSFSISRQGSIIFFFFFFLNTKKKKKKMKSI